LDTLMPESGRHALAQELGDRLVVEEVGHAPQQTRPGLVVREMVRLLEQLSQSERTAPGDEPENQHAEPVDALEQQLRA